MELTVENVEEVFKDFLFREGEDVTKAVKVAGIVHNYGFHPERLKSHFDDIDRFLNQLPDSFHERSGGGMSFLNMCDDKDGHQWGEHLYMEQLVALGTGVSRVKYCMSRDMWTVFPGGMPYIVILKREPRWFDNEKESEVHGKARCAE